jgi:hypothetical protein
VAEAARYFGVGIVCGLCSLFESARGVSDPLLRESMLQMIVNVFSGNLLKRRIVRREGNGYPFIFIYGHVMD